MIVVLFRMNPDSCSRSHHHVPFQNAVIMSNRVISTIGEELVELVIDHSVYIFLEDGLLFLLHWTTLLSATRL